MRAGADPYAGCAGVLGADAGQDEPPAVRGQHAVEPGSGAQRRPDGDAAEGMEGGGEAVRSGCVEGVHDPAADGGVVEEPSGGGRRGRLGPLQEAPVPVERGTGGRR